MRGVVYCLYDFLLKEWLNMKNINTVPPNLKYGYEMTLSLARPGTPFSQEDRQFLEQAIAEYNGKSKTNQFIGGSRQLY